jgi:tetratricopeptide (TPR) repeat protein
MRNRKIRLGMLVLALVTGISFESHGQNSALNGTWVPETGDKSPFGELRLNNGRIDTDMFFKGTYTYSGGNIKITITDFYGALLPTEILVMGQLEPMRFYSRADFREGIRNSSILGALLISQAINEDEMIDALFQTETVAVSGGSRFKLFINGEMYVKKQAGASSGSGRQPQPAQPAAAPSMSAEAYFNRGCEYLDKRDFDRAIAEFTQAIRLNPNKAVYYGNRGVAYNRKGDYDRAIADFTAVLRINPNDDEAVKYLALVLDNRGLTSVIKGDLDRAIADFTEAVQLEPSNQNYRDDLRKTQDAKARQGR